MKKLILAVTFVAVTISLQAQNWREADSLRKVLRSNNPDTTRVRLLLRLAEFEIFKPGERKTDLDSAAAYLNQATIINQRAKSTDMDGYIALTRSRLVNERGQKPQGKALAEEAIKLLEQGNDKYQLGKAYLNLADYYNALDLAELPKKTQIVEQSTKMFEQGGYIREAAAGYQMLGDFTQDPGMSLNYLKQALKLYQSVHYEKLQGIYDLIGNVYLYNTDFKEALKWELDALKVAETVGDTTMQLCEINNHIGINYFKQLDFKQAVKYFRAALKTAEAYNDASTVYALVANISDSYRRSHQSAEVISILKHVLAKYPLPKDDFRTDFRVTGSYLQAYTELNQFDLAKPYSDHLLSLIGSTKMTNTFLSDTYAMLISYFFASKQYEKMLTYLTKNGILSDKLGISTNISVNNQMWFRLDTAQRNYKSAVYHLLKTDRIKDSTFNATKNKQIQEIQVKFDTKKKEDQIKLLNQQSALDQGNLQRANFLKNATAGGIILVLIIAGLLYRQNRLKQKNNEVITHKNDVITHKNELLQSLVAEKEWLLKEVHHRVKNNLHSVICLLESQAAYLESDALRAIEESQHRIYTMSLIHQKLYQSDDVKTIDMEVYIPELVQYLEDSFDVSNRIHFNLVVEPIHLNASQAIPLALIINEALTNSIKYAFPDNRRGEIIISFSDIGGRYQLELADNGIGLDKNKKDNGEGSLGLELMKGLTKEIMGDISIESYNGVKITITFDHDALNEMEVLQSDYLIPA